MSYFNNDHLQINNIIIDFEENIGKISSINQILNSIDNIDEFNELKNQLNILFTDIENDTNTLINTLKIVQFNIRKLYDDFSLLQNNYEDIEEKLKMIINDNTLLIHKNKEINIEMNSKNQKIIEQEEYINKLIEIIKNNEINNKNDIMIKTSKTNKDKYKNMLKSADTSIENMKKNTFNNFNYMMKKNNSVNLKKIQNNNIPNLNDIKEFKITNENFEKNKVQINNIINSNNNKNSSTIVKNNINSINTGKYVFNYDLSQDEPNNNIDKNDNYNSINIKNRMEKVEKIISIIYKNNNLYLNLKNKYGNDFESKILNENINSELLDQILKDISEFSNYKNNKSSNKKEKNSINEKNKNIGKGDKRKRYIEDNINFFKEDETGSKLTNYFLFNLHREKMIDSQQKKDLIKPKTPKL